MNGYLAATLVSLDIGVSRTAFTWLKFIDVKKSGLVKITSNNASKSIFVIIITPVS